MDSHRRLSLGSIEPSTGGHVSPVDMLQFLLAFLTVVGLLVTVYYSHKGLKVARQDMVTSVFLSLNQKLQATLYGILESDSQILQEHREEKLQPYKFGFYKMIDLIADIYQMKAIMIEGDKALWETSEAKLSKLLSKPAVQALITVQFRQNPELFSLAFMDYVRERTVS
jgi:hypothetical protein